MKTLVSKKMESIALALLHSEFEVYVHDKNDVSTFDAFDRFNPEMAVIDETYIDSTVIKCLAERPYMKLAIFIDHYSEASKTVEKLLNDAIGSNYYVVDYISIYDPVLCSNAKYDKKYAARFVVVETSPIEGLESLDVGLNTSFKIFSSCRVIDNINFCGIVTKEEIPSIFASATKVLTNPENAANANALGCIVKTKMEEFSDGTPYNIFTPKPKQKDSFLYLCDIFNHFKMTNKITAVTKARERFI